MGHDVRQTSLQAIAIESPVAALNAAFPMLSLSATVELAWLLCGARELIRLACGEAQLDALLGGLTSRDIAGHACEGRLFPRAQTALGGYAFGGSYVENPGSTGGLALVFVAHDKARARAGRRLHDAGDDEAVGAALGYPTCCTAAFTRNRAAHAVGFEALFAAGRGPWPWWSNALLAPFGWLPVSHLPCAPDCAHTRVQALTQHSALDRFDAPFAAFMRSRLSSLVVWHPELGIAAKPRNGLWTASGGLRRHLRGDSIELNADLGAQSHWIDHRAVR